ncbi:hypothetical protein TSTA_048190 [Talaromyces stipitatus ATCC 10500]|uniref:PHD-type domain-containing protein n=1 Tax=Talaromyces stipitatus (strain ATCC 10500 / CBS 375.48 / QM 6759 / NRRL 1006) TaxID=441959 RepID=B8MKM1_TALSN|nr:uncharacterized protein TSTA_048190 [Talaromyces stipitatus ATCC 10500]EED15376.1 hypothetical protein TSTA_048190 [Talaromyces stipitatus ATCC 10500]
MPRARTKYIWPPPILANDTAILPPQRADATTTPTITNATNSEPRGKKPRLAASKRRTTSQRNTPASEDRGVSRAGDNQDKADKAGEEAVEWDPDSDTAPPSVEVAIAAYARIPMETQIQRYREWRRFGSIHEDFCMACRKSGPENLVPCFTCSKSFHDRCIPRGSLYNERRQWFCAVCVHRNWHEQPPTLTPPASPSPEPLADNNQQTQGNPRKRGNAHLADQEENATSTGNNSQALSILAEISRSMSRGETRRANVPSHRFPEVSAPYSPNPSSITLPSISTRPEFGLTAPSPSAYVGGGGSILDSHARKSKFATLSSEVDSALWVLYRELESVTSLRQRIGELESEIVKLRQDVSIRDNQLILSRRSMSVHGSLPNGISQTEIDRLRVQAAKVEEVTRQTESLRAKNEALEKALEEAKAESASKDKTLNEWKGRLVSLIGN